MKKLMGILLVSSMSLRYGVGAERNFDKSTGRGWNLHWKALFALPLAPV